MHFDSENMFDNTKDMIHSNAVTEKLNTSRRVDTGGSMNSCFSVYLPT